jgi:hypothetical protein
MPPTYQFILGGYLTALIILVSSLHIKNERTARKTLTAGVIVMLCVTYLYELFTR